MEGAQLAESLGGAWVVMHSDSPASVSPSVIYDARGEDACWLWGQSTPLESLLKHLLLL